MRRVFFGAAVLSLLFMAGWGGYMANAHTEAAWNQRMNDLSVGGPLRDVSEPGPIGLWVGGVLAVVFLVAGLASGAPVSTGARTKCPFCAEDIAREAKVCKHCGRDLRGPSQQHVPATPGPEAATSAAAAPLMKPGTERAVLLLILLLVLAVVVFSMR